jgi:hypothetical protein
MTRTDARPNGVPMVTTTAKPQDHPHGRLRACARELMRNPSLRQGLRTDPEHRSWVRVEDPGGGEAWLISWPPGTRTGWHDHGGSRGAFAVLEGSLEEHTPAAPRTAHGHEIVLPAAGPRLRVLVSGSARAFGPHHVHDVLNTGSVHAVSLHLYDPALPLMRRFERDGDVLRLVAVEHAAEWS